MRLHFDGEQAIDNVALELLKTNRHWIGASGSIILDIDEDYFGVELAGQRLVDAGFDWNMLTLMSSPLTRLFCPKHIKHEGLGNRLMFEVITTILRRCYAYVKLYQHSCRIPAGKVSSLVRKVALVYWQRDRLLFCPYNVTRLLDLTDELTSVLYRFRLRDLLVLREFGFCLSAAPASTEFTRKGYGGLVVCLGANTPNSNVVFLHKPDAVEIWARTVQLRDILYILDFYHTPSIVTLCRSVRDGYTPRSLFSSIESNILDIFKELPGVYEVVYDKNLYGGQGGWPDRHKIQDAADIVK